MSDDKTYGQVIHDLLGQLDPARPAEYIAVMRRIQGVTCEAIWFMTRVAATTAAPDPAGHGMQPDEWCVELPR